MLKLRFVSAVIYGSGWLSLGVIPSSRRSRTALFWDDVYNFKTRENRSTDHEWDRLTLFPDGKYDLVRGGPTKGKSEKTGRWHFHDGDPAEVDLDQAGFPVRVERGEIRLLIDDDVGFGT